MANKLGFYNPTFYAQEALIVLEKALGWAARVHRGYDPTPSQKGDTINISKPGTFTVQDAPSTAQDVNTGGVSIQLTEWKEVKFALSDKELTFTKEKIIEDHIRPAAYALADYIDSSMAQMYKDVYYFAGTPGTTPTNYRTLTTGRRLLNEHMVPDDGQRHWMIDTAMEEEMLNLSLFNQSPATDVTKQTILRGSLGEKLGIEMYASPNSQYHTKGTLAPAATIALNALVAQGATTAVLKDSGGGALTGVMKKGDVFSVAGDTQTYVCLADATAAGNQCAITFSPAAKLSWAANAVVTVKASHMNNLLFHRNAFALACAPLSDIGTSFGNVQLAIIDFNGLALRSRMWYEPGTSKVNVALDILYGFKTLDPELAIRYAG